MYVANTVLYLRMLDDAIKQRFVELSVIVLVVFVWTSLENLSKSNVTVNSLVEGTLKIDFATKSISKHQSRFNSIKAPQQYSLVLPNSCFIQQAKFHVTKWDSNPQPLFIHFAGHTYITHL